MCFVQPQYIILIYSHKTAQALKCTASAFAEGAVRVYWTRHPATRAAAFSKFIVKASGRWPGQGEWKWEYGRLLFQGKMEKYKNKKTIFQERGKNPGAVCPFCWNSLCSAPKGKKTDPPDWMTVSLLCNSESLYS